MPAYALGMNREDIDLLATEFGLTLPAKWAGYMLSYPAALQGLVRPNGIGVREYEFCHEPQLLKELNEDVRFGPVIDSENILYDWPEEFLVIGDNGVGDYFCIDTNDAECNVLYFDHQLGEFFELGETLDTFVECLVEQYGQSMG